MKKYYSPEITDVEYKTIVEPDIKPMPRPSTIAFLKQFARSYMAVSNPAMPGVVLS